VTSYGHSNDVARIHARHGDVGVWDGHARDVLVTYPAGVVIPLASITACETVVVPVDPTHVEPHQRFHPALRKPTCMHS
jgi:hypothetical protein